MNVTRQMVLGFNHLSAFVIELAYGSVAYPDTKTPD
jgi:hypothetical protein